jgi:hypothetical protein
MLGSIISAGGSLAGGLLSGKQSNKQANKAWRRQQEVAKNRLQWTVADAKKAGLHPLFALGAGGGSSAGGFIQGQSPMGSAIADAAAHIGSGLAGRKTGGEKLLAQAQIESINSQTRRNDAEAALALSRARRVADEANYRQDGLLQTGDESTGVPSGKITPKAPEVRSTTRGDRARQAGKNPTWQRYQYGPRSDQWIDIPYSDEGPFEEFGPAKAVATLLRMLQNRAKRAPLPRRSRRKRKLTRRGTR